MQGEPAGQQGEYLQTAKVLSFRGYKPLFGDIRPIRGIYILIWGARCSP